MYWRWQSLPELADLPKADRKRLWRQAFSHPFELRDFGWLALILTAMAVFALLMLNFPKGLPIWIELPMWVAAFLLMGKVIDAIVIARYRPVLSKLTRLHVDSETARLG